MNQKFTPIPDILSLIVCDQIITDRITGKQSLIGMFSTIHSMQFPVIHPQLCVFVALTEGHGKTPLEIRIVDAEGAHSPLVRGQGVVDFKNPLAIAHLALQFHGLRFPQPAGYRVQLWCQESLLREARLQLVQAPPPQARPEGTQAAGE
jgi:hypothetical protein